MQQYHRISRHDKQLTDFLWKNEMPEILNRISMSHSYLSYRTIAIDYEYRGVGYVWIARSIDIVNTHHLDLDSYRYSMSIPNYYVLRILTMECLYLVRRGYYSKAFYLQCSITICIFPTKGFDIAVEHDNCFSVLINRSYPTKF